MTIWAENLEISVLKGQTVDKVELSDAKDEIQFYVGPKLYRMYHEQN